MIDLLIDGVILGSVLAMGAVSLSMVYGVLNFPNLAHGDFLAFGAYGVLLANKFLGLGILESVVFTIPLSLILGISLEKILWNPLREKGAGLITLLIVSMGLALVIRNSMTAIFGGSYHYYEIPASTQLNFFGLQISNYGLLVIVISIISMVILHYLLQRTTLGKSMRALSDNMDLARVSGIEVESVITKMWFIVMILTALGGALYGVITVVRPSMGFYLLLPIFAAIILGGIGNIYGAMVGGLVLGVCEELSTAFIPTEYKVAVPFAILILVLSIRPKGLFRGLR